MEEAEVVGRRIQAEISDFTITESPKLDAGDRFVSSLYDAWTTIREPEEANNAE